MINYNKISDGLIESRMEIPGVGVDEAFLALREASVNGGDVGVRPGFVLESVDVSHIYGRLSLIGVDPVLRISGKGDDFVVKVLNERGQRFLDEIENEDLEFCDEFDRQEDRIVGKVSKEEQVLEESKRSLRKNSGQIVRMILKKFKTEKKVMMGLYGGFSYDFIRLFEDLPEELEEGEVKDFDLCLYDSFVHFDLLKEVSEVVVYRNSEQESDEAIHQIVSAIAKSGGEIGDFSIDDAGFEMGKEDYEDLVEIARKYALEGELFEVVFANSLKAKFGGDAFGLYCRYREVNPSPYLFYFDFGDGEYLVGASPEMMVRVEKGVAHLRPISGTAKRGKDPIEDHDNMLKLLADPKERAELDMLIDLGRNDLSRICEPGIEIKDYRFVEKYSRVMHTIAHLQGRLSDGYMAYDALIACLNAGTLTGAPKVAAMAAIERHEKERRGYYGGTIGYLTFSGEMDTGIIIRTAHIVGDKLDLKAGATLLFDSNPESEYQETINKAKAFLDII